MENLCRICSNIGPYNIFEKIPHFLHENLNDNLCFNKTISQLLSEITDLPIEKNDGLPQKICEICISYMKHATMFRQQARNNIFSLVKANNINNIDNITIQKENSDNINKNNSNLLLKEKKIIKNNTTTNIFNYNKISNKENVQMLEKNIIENDENELKKNNNTDNEICCFKKDEDKKSLTFLKKNEKIDVSAKSSPLRAIIKTPEIFKEHKCVYCKRRYMSVESYCNHLEECIEKKLKNFVWKINYIMDIKEHNKIRPNTFIRLMITHLKESLITLGKFYDFFPDIVTNDLITDTNEKEELLKKLDCVLNFINLNTTNNDNEKDFNELENYKRFHTISELSTPINNNSPTTILLPQIRCSECSISFDSLVGLELHNYKFHNKINLTDRSSSETLLELFENQEGFVDVTTVHSLNNIMINNEIIKKNDKLIKCQICGKEFYTFGHLDHHMRQHKKQ